MRMALALIALFWVVSLLSLGGSYLVIRRSLEDGISADLEQNMAGFRAAPSSSALAALISAEAAVTDPDERILSYIGPDGRHYGNALIARSADGFRILRKDASRSANDESYLILSTTLYGGQLSIATSLSRISDLRETFINILLLSLAPTMVLALGFGVLIARRSAQRLKAVEGTLDRLTRGDLSARMPVLSGWSDDISTIGSSVDRMAKAQQASVSALKQVSADIAHDLKTPIQRVAMLLRQLSQARDLGPDALILVEKAAAETDGIVATFQSLLQIAQIEGGSPKARFKPVDLAALAQTFTEVYEPAAEDGQHQLKLTAPKSEPAMVNGDKGLLGQVFANLIENALRHTPPGSRIDITITQADGQVKLIVADNGPGIPQTERENVLRRLYRLEQSRTTPGNGLGLSLVSVIADLHDAELTLGSNSPGLVVTLAFNVVAASPVADKTTNEDHQNGG